MERSGMAATTVWLDAAAVERLRDAIAHHGLTLTAVMEASIGHVVSRLERQHNGGEPFPTRDTPEGKGRGSWPWSQAAVPDDDAPLVFRKRRRGLASMSPEERRRIASMGGKTAHAQGKAHQFTSEEAAAAGRKGGKAAQANGKAFDVNKHNQQRKRRKK